MNKIENRKIVIVNQAANYLTIGFCNSFYEKFNSVSLITGSIHTQGENLAQGIKVTKINKWVECPSWKKTLSYILGCLRIWLLLLTKFRKHEVFFVSLPPMAYLLNLVVPNRSSIVIWDVYPDVFKITGMTESNWLFRFWAYLNKKSFEKAFRLFTISEKMKELVAQYIPPEKIIIQPIWSIFQQNDKISKTLNPFVRKHKLCGKFVIQYSGNIGLTHKVEVLIEIAEKMKKNQDIVFQIIGRGPRKKYLKRIVEEKKLPNCKFLPFQSDKMFPYSLSAADIGVVILDETTSKGSVPSKSYNLMSYGIPSLYIASEDSQLNLYAQKYRHAQCFSENSINKAVDFISQLNRDKELYRRLSRNSCIAAKDFKRQNAMNFVLQYLKKET